MRITGASTWPVVRAQRALLVDDLRGLPSEAWTTPSLCPGWDVHDVLAHLVDGAKTSRLGFVRRMIAARFDFDRDNAAGVAREKRSEPAATLDALSAVVDLTRTPPANLATRLVEAFVHGEDIRRPLGLVAAYPVSSVGDALAYQARTAVSFGGGRERITGLRLIATDGPFVHGDEDGHEVRGRTLDLLLAVSGRPVPTGSLDGSGVEMLCR